MISIACNNLLLKGFHFQLIFTQQCKIAVIRQAQPLQKEIVACNANHRVEEGFETLKKFEQIADHDDQIAQQFILRSKVLLGRLDQRYTPQEQIDLLLQAIRLTVPRFNLDEIERFFYFVHHRSMQFQFD